MNDLNCGYFLIYVVYKPHLQNNLRKDENPQWVDSSDSYSDSEDETSRPTANQSSRCIKSKVQDEKRDAHGNKANYTCIDLLSNSASEDETSRPSANQSSCCIKSKVQDEKKDAHGNKANYTRTNLPYVQAYLAQKDSFSVYGEIVAHRMRKAKKSSKAVARVEWEIDSILRKFETGVFDSSEDTFK
ncbi:hypothetical protein AVEN_108793-1 [Araneus ventricosus]|uniref:Uncharacterized protein n=1 Tax=Araneus ventricosus TaxID=182803 RepID=A0A4Y2CEE1_ARAVE|nr:hypothetical protein AVEN_108793-1 [Araneus ventricosus]